MPLDSLGLGLTLDTTLLEKADKTLENMHKNSKLIMQNLTRGFTSFNSGGADALTKMSTALGHVSDALTKIDNAKVSPDFDTKGQEKYINRMQQLLDIVEKMSKISGAKFYDPTEVYATDKEASDIFAEIEELKEYKDELKELIDTVNNYGEVQSKLSKKAREQKEAISKQEEEVKKLAKTYKEAEAKFNSSMEALSKFRDEFFDSKRKKKPSLTDEEIQEMYSSSKSKTKSALLKQLEEERVAINEAMESLDNAYKDLAKKREALNKTTTEYKENRDAKNNIERIKIEYNNLREREKILRAELKFAQATQAERAAMLTKKNEAEIKADQKRIRDVQKSYEQLRKEIQKGEKDIADLEASRQTLKEANRPTKGIDNEIKRRRNELNKLMQDELEFRSSQYWPKLQAIDEKFNSEAFVKNQKALAKLAAKESRKDVTAAIQFSTQAKTINEEKEAIKRLIEARDNLSTSTARYKKTVTDINKRILAHKDHIEAVTRVEKEQNTLADSVINRYRKQLKALDEVNEALEKQMKIERKTSVADLDPTNADTQALLARQKTIAADIDDIESRAQGELDVIKEQHEAERAKKRIEETLRQNEREKQEYAKLLDDLYAIEKQKKAMKDAGAKKGDKAYDNILQQEQDLNNQIYQLKAKHKNDLDEIDKKHAKKRNDDDVKAFIDAQKEKLRIAEKTQKEIDAYNEKYGTTSKRNAEMAITSFSGAQNINQHKQAIEGLQQVRARLDNTDKDYYKTLKQLNQAIHSHELYIRAAENESTKLTNSHRGLMDISGQLMRRLALAFSVSQMTQYFKKLVEVRGQFEKTEVALTSIIGDGQKAQKLMNQTISLAVKSPFTLQQLTSYTKQLAAYQVSYEELHSTTKMLADVSAGLGVEMDRLILAFGQVKAANYLRATEVRQFTEAGFNILEELAKYYTKIDGINVTVGEVQDKVTKRMVSFEDVAEVFKRVTQEGSRFYEMQSKQAETLAGQWTNLQDRIDIMLNEIGTSGEGALKSIVNFLASAIDNWDVLASSLKTAVSAFVIFKAYSLLAGDGLKLLAIDMRVLTDQIPKVMKLGDAFKTLTRVVKSAVSNIGASMSTLLTNPIFLAVAAIGTLLAAGGAWLRHHKQMREALAEQDKVLNENTSSLQRLNEKYKEASKSSGEYKKKLELLRELSNNLKDRNLTLSVKIEDVDETNIDKVFEENSKRLQKAYDLGKDLGQAIAKGMNEAQGNLFGFSFFGENLKEDAEDYGQSMGKLMSWGMQVQMKNIENAARVNYKQMGKHARDYYDSIKGGKGKFESEYEWTKRRATALVMISKLEGDIVGKNKELQKTLRSVVADGIELHHESKGIYDNLVEAAGGLGNLRKEATSNPIELAAQIKTEVDKLDYDPASKQFIINDLYAMLHLRVNYVEDPNATPTYDWSGFKKDLKDSREDLKAFKDAKGEGLGYENFFFSENEIKQLGKFSDALEAIQKKYDENKKTIEQLSGTSDEYSKEERKRLEALQAELKEVAAKWNYDLDAKNKKGDNDALKRLKDQIKLIKDANKAYEERNKKFGKEESQAVVSDSYKEAFKKVELAIEDIDYTNLEGVVKALEDLEDEAKKAGGAVELLKAISEVKAEIGLTLKERQDRELFDQVQEIFDDYELAVDIKKLNIPSDLAKNLFGIDTKSFDQMKSEIISKFAGTKQEVSDILSKGTILSSKDETKLIEAIGKERVEQAIKALNQIDNLEKKQQEESAKRFVEFLTKNLNETTVVLEQKGVDISFAKSLFDKGMISAQQFAEVVREISRQANEDISKINFDNFKKSSIYIKAMGELAAYSSRELESMANALEKALAEGAKDMGVDELQAYHNALARINKERKKFKPFISENEIGKLVEYLELEKQLTDEQEKRKELQKEKNTLEFKRASLLDLIEQTQARQQKGELASTSNLTQQLQNTENAIQQIDGAISNADMNISNISGQMGQISGGASGALMMVDAIIKGVYDSIKATIQMFEEAKEMADSFGVDTDKGGWREASQFFNTLGNFNEKAMSGWENLKSGNIIGAVADTAGSIMGLVRDINKWKDSGLEESIESHIERIKDLEKEYEKLEWVIDRSLSIEKYGKVAEQTNNLGEQLKSTSQAIALEQGKKNVDEERIKELRENAEEAQREVQELYDNLREEIVGSYEDLSSTLADSMIEALKNGEDALKAWSDEVDNIIANIVTKLAVQKYVEPQVSRVLDQFYNKVLPKNAAAEKAFTRLQSLEIGSDAYNQALAEWERLNSEAVGELPQLSEEAVNDLKESLNAVGVAFEPIAEQIAGIYGEQGGELSSLQKGIQGITEDQADILAAYWNSVRAYTASIDSKMDMILANMSISTENNPILEQLMSQTSWLSKIHGILDEITTTRNEISGKRVKMIM